MNGKTRDCLLFMLCNAPCPSQEGLRQIYSKATEVRTSRLTGSKGCYLEDMPCCHAPPHFREAGRFLPHEPCSHTRDRKGRPHPESGDELLEATCLGTHLLGSLSAAGETL